LKLSISEIKAVFELGASGLNYFRKRRNPIRSQSDRFLRAFEDHGVARQQITRVLPDEFDIKHEAFSSAEQLVGHLTPELLDWASNYLALDRSWLDGIGDRPHQDLEIYKDTSAYSDWLKQRIELEPNVDRSVYIWATSDLNHSTNSSYYLSIVFEEYFGDLDDTNLCRYWTISNQWSADHKPCINSMLKIINISRSNNVLPIGRVLSKKALHDFEEGNLFAPQVKKQVKAIWYPEDLDNLYSVA